jgi:hypothetical protein
MIGARSYVLEFWKRGQFESQAMPRRRRPPAASEACQSLARLVRHTSCDGAVGRRRQVIPDVMVAFGRFLSFKALYMGKITSDGSPNVSARLADLLKKAVHAAGTTAAVQRHTGLRKCMQCYDMDAGMYCMYVCMYACMWACVLFGMYACTHVRMHVSIHAHVYCRKRSCRASSATLGTRS